MFDFKFLIERYFSIRDKCNQLTSKTQKALIRNKGILSYIQNERININLIEEETIDKRKFYRDAKRAYNDFNDLMFLVIEIKDAISSKHKKRINLPGVLKKETLDVLFCEFKMICSRLDFDKEADIDLRHTVSESISIIQRTLNFDYIDIND